MAKFLKLIVVPYFIFQAASAQAQHLTTGTIDDMNGIAAAFRCSASIVSLGQADSDPAFVLSAGHCSADNPDGGYTPGTAKIRLPILSLDEHISYYQKLGDDQPLTLGNFQLSSIYYATMTREDVTLFQGALSLGVLKSRGVRIFKLADRLPKPGEKLQITSGLWGQTQSCTVERIILDNADEKKLFGISPSPIEMNNTILLGPECTARPGWSGSPLLDPKTGLIYGVASRIYTPAPGSALAKEGTSPRILVSSLLELRKCINKTGQLDFSLLGCQLPSKK